ncbi:DUF4169 family protein [Rhodobacteraceae bacterium]|nr:DUF4169 family protein [Paracoccaceae bacterium]
MNNVTNLNKFRKAKARDEKRAQAKTNAVKFGRSKSEKQTEKSTLEKQSDFLNAHQIPPTRE